MTKHWLRIGVLGLGLVALGWVGAADDRGDAKSLKKVMDDYAAAMNRGDLDTVVGFWAKDAEFEDEDGSVLSGQKAIAKQIKENMDDLKGAKIRFAIDKLRTLRADVISEDGHSIVTDADGDSEKSRYHAIWIKSDGKWLISSVRMLLLAAADAAVSESPLKQLGWLVGEWAPEDKAIPMTVKCHWALSKRFLVVDYVVKGKKDDDLSVTKWIGWDPHMESIRSWVFDSLGGLGDGYWTREGNTWLIDAAGVLPDGDPASAVNSIRLVNERTFVWRSTDREVNGVPIADNEIRFVKK